MADRSKLTAAELELCSEPGGDYIVRSNLLTEPGYTGYCGGAMHKDSRCSMPRTHWVPSLGQFKCPDCGWVSGYPDHFIAYYRHKWSK